MRDLVGGLACLYISLILIMIPTFRQLLSSSGLGESDGAFIGMGQARNLVLGVLSVLVRQLAC